MKRLLLSFGCIAIAAIMAACSNTDTEYRDELITVQQLNTTAGYAWFPAETATYTPDAAMVNQIRTEFDTTQHKLLIFVKPSCACRGTQKLFPQVMKSLMQADVPMRKVEIYSMRSSGDQHPYMKDITLTALPAVYVLRNGEIKRIIVDNDYTGSNADSLMARALRQ